MERANSSVTATAASRKKAQAKNHWKDGLNEIAGRNSSKTKRDYSLTLAGPPKMDSLFCFFYFLLARSKSSCMFVSWRFERPTHVYKTNFLGSVVLLKVFGDCFVCRRNWRIGRVIVYVLDIRKTFLV